MHFKPVKMIRLSRLLSLLTTLNSISPFRSSMTAGLKWSVNYVLGILASAYLLGERNWVGSLCDFREGFWAMAVRAFESFVTDWGVWVCLGLSFGDCQ